MIEKEKNYYSVKEMETPVSLTENLNARQTLHLLFERQARYKKALAFLEEDDFVEHSFLVKRDENDEEQIHSVTHSGIIFIMSAARYKKGEPALVTVLIARPTQVKRLYNPCNLEMSEHLQDRCFRHSMMGVNHVD